MTPEQEKQLLQALYDRLFDAITYQPQGGKNPFGQKETFIHFAKNEGVNPASFKDAKSPFNPTGDLATAEYFSAMVDKVSPMDLEWNPPEAPLSKIYKQIVDGSNTSQAVRPSKEALAVYQKAYDYLHPIVKEENPFTHQMTETKGDSKEFKEYQDNLDAYTDAIKKYRTSYNMYLDDYADAEEKQDAAAKKKAQREWTATEPPLSSAIKKAQQALLAGNSKWVVMALDTLNTSINDGVSQALVAAKQDVADDRFYPSQLGGQGGPWLLAYAMPNNWFSEDADALKNFTELRFSSKTKREDKTSTSHAYTFGASYNAGLWGVKAESQGKFEDSRRHMTGDDVEVSCKIAKVSIMRPWFNEFIFRTGNWYTNLRTKSEKEYISSGKIDDSNRGKMLPMYPVAFIVARDVTIKANFSEEDEKHISQAVSASASVSYGPFSIGGSYSYGKKEDNFYASYQGGAIRVPGIQVIGWVSKLVPACPLQSWQELEPSGAGARA